MSHVRCSLIICFHRHTLFTVFASTQSQGPTTASRSDGTRFWIDSSFQMALATIISQNLYSGQVVEDSELASPSMICIQEVESPIVCPITLYICRLRNYTELDVRAIARPLAQCIQKLHNAGIAHRNLHTGNIIIDPFVSIALSCHLCMCVSKRHINSRFMVLIFAGNS